MAADSPDTQSKPDPAPRRKFAVEPIETSTRSSKEARAKQEKEQAATQPRRRFLPQPIEESSRSSKDSKQNGVHTGPATPNGTAEKKPRKFAVQPVETVKRARRRNSGNALQPGDGTDESSSNILSSRLRADLAPPVPTNSPSPGVVNPFDEPSPATSVPESRFSYAALARKSSRQSSIRRPSLEPISSLPESDESNLSKPSTASTSESTHMEAQHAPKLQVPRQKNLQKESYDEVFNVYLLDLAAQQAQQQLRQQAADAYPNERIHEPVDHFAVDKESDSDTEVGVGQLSGGANDVAPKHPEKSTVGMEATDFQKLRVSAEEKKTKISPAPSAGSRKDPFGAAFNMAGIGAEASAPRDPELKSMRQVARPPMLGASLVFPTCPSPRMTMIDPLQRHGTRKNTHAASRPTSGLWCASPGVASPPKRESPKSSVCLWGGNCTASQAQRLHVPDDPNVQTGILTPALAPDEDPLNRWNNDEPLQSQLRKQHQLSSNPGSRVNSILGIDQLLALEQRILEEYPDSFVTQIYNYLSLGYPAIAEEFDDELSKISKISVEEIRNDDARKNTKGYVNAPEGKGAGEDDVRTNCGRWRALRLYIHEWARQQPYMHMEGADATWSTSARRGSWFS